MIITQSKQRTEKTIQSTLNFEYNDQDLKIISPFLSVL